MLLGPCFDVEEPPPSTPDQSGLRINSSIGIRIVFELCFGATEPPPGTPDQAGLRIKSVIEIIMLLELGLGCEGAAA